MDIFGFKRRKLEKQRLIEEQHKVAVETFKNNILKEEKDFIEDIEQTIEKVKQLKSQYSDPLILRTIESIIVNYPIKKYYEFYSQRKIEFEKRDDFAENYIQELYLTNNSQLSEFNSYKTIDISETLDGQIYELYKAFVESFFNLTKSNLLEDNQHQKLFLEDRRFFNLSVNELKIPSIILPQNNSIVYFYPTFLIYQIDDTTFNLYGYEQFIVGNFSLEKTQYDPWGNIPSDATIVKYKWQYSTKNGEKDYRYKDNQRYTVYSLDYVYLKSRNQNIKLEFVISNHFYALHFYEILKSIHDKLAYPTYNNYKSSFSTQNQITEKKIIKETPLNQSSTQEIIKPSSGILELKNLIGLESVKKDISSLLNFINIQKLRKEKNLKITPVSLHTVFTGNPGTGKTTVARIMAQIFKDLGLISKGHLVETDRSGLVAEYIGQTAIKTNKIIDSALDGILFIDEAYSLVPDKTPNDFGLEAIATLLKRMEDDRDRLIVILAGYKEEMNKFIEANPGLQSRFNRYINFEDYNDKELYEIFKSLADKNSYFLSEAAKEGLYNFFKETIENKPLNFGNGRFVRNIFEKAIQNQATRLSQISNPSIQDLQTLLPVDLGFL